jgi:paraquat-inducible protein B
MTETPPGPDLPEFPAAVAVPRRRWSPSLVWLIPIVAAVIGGWLAVKGIMERGPVITIGFNTAEGLEAGKTRIKYKDVEIGLVKSIALAEDRKGVVVTAELTKQTEGFLVEDARFWVVRPRVAGGSVSGIGTLFSGAYIGFEAGKSAQQRREFTGLETQPVVTAGLPGRHFILASEDLGFLDIGAPIYFRRIPVGQVVAFELDKDGAGVTFKVFINAPYDRYVTGNTRFWQASGVDVTLDASGFRVNTESLASILIGGIAFQTPPDSTPAPQARENTAFTLFADRALALKHPDTVVETYRLVFKESVRGLSVGAPVDFRGFVIGEVAALNMELDAATSEVGMVVHVYLYPERFRRRNAGAQLAMDSKATLDAMVARGLRAQLRTGNLLTGQLYVALDFFPKAPKAKLDWNSKPVELPVMPASLQELQATLAEITKKLEKVPFEGIGTDLRQTLQSLDRTLQNTDKLVQRVDKEVAPQARAAIEEARRTFAAAERTLAADAPLQQDARTALRELTRAAEALRVLADYLDRHPEALLRGKKEEQP